MTPPLFIGLRRGSMATAPSTTQHLAANVITFTFTFMPS